MGSHPLNLAVRFLLELSALLVSGIWGWQQGNGWLSFTLALGLPVLLAAIWGLFNVPGDPSRSGAAPVQVPGIVRLIIELGIFFIASWALLDLGFTTLGWILGAIVVIHYFVSYDRIIWLIRH